MKAKMILFSLLMCGIGVHAVPIIMIAPADINTAAGYTISATGSYLLSDDVVAAFVSSGNKAINITSSHVVLDLNNKSLIVPVGGGIGITNVGNVTIRNGKIFNCADSGITGTNITNVTIDTINSSSNSVMGINMKGGGQWFIRNCITESNTFTGISLAGKDMEVSNCVSENNISGLTLNLSSENARIFGGRYNRNSSGGITIVTSTQVVIEQLQANDNNGSAGISLFSGSDFFVNNCLTQKNTGTGIALTNLVGFSAVYGSKALHNGVDGIGNNSGTSAVFGTLAFGNVLNNFGGTGPVAAVQVQNGGQMNPGSVIDPQVDNISIS